MSDETEPTARASTVRNETTLEARSVMLGHALGLYPLRSATKEFLAEVTCRLGDDYDEDDVETLTTGLKAAKLRDDAAEALGVDEVGSSLGPVVHTTIAELEAEYDASIRELAEENTNDPEAFEESTYKTFDTFDR